MFIFSCLQHVVMEILGLQGASPLWKVVWKCAMMGCGEQYAVTIGAEQM